MVNLLIDSGADVSMKGKYSPIYYLFRETDNYDDMAVIDTVFSEELKILRLLLDNGVDINTDVRGKTLLQHALERQWFSVINVLVGYGASYSGDENYQKIRNSRIHG